jgi:hypothetical protein
MKTGSDKYSSIRLIPFNSHEYSGFERFARFVLYALHREIESVPFVFPGKYDALHQVWLHSQYFLSAGFGIHLSRSIVDFWFKAWIANGSNSVRNLEVSEVE